MDWIFWALLLAVGLISGVAGAFLYSRQAALQRVVASCWFRLQPRLQALLGRRKPPKPAAVAPRSRASEDVVVLIPDGRPWPLGAAVQLLELAWRWQVVHGANLPARARQGEGAYVWRPPLPAHTLTQQQGAEAEH